MRINNNGNNNGKGVYVSAFMCWVIQCIFQFTVSHIQAYSQPPL